MYGVVVVGVMMRIMWVLCILPIFVPVRVMNAFGDSLFPLTDRYHDALFAPASVGDLQRLAELVPCGVRFRNPILLQFAADLRDLFLHILQLTHDHRERRPRWGVTDISQYGHIHALEAMCVPHSWHWEHGHDGFLSFFSAPSLHLQVYRSCNRLLSV